MAGVEGVEEEDDFNIKFREDEELEFFTELALHETERWIQAVTKKTMQYSDDTRKSLENGVLLCELLNALQPGSIKRINRLPTPIAGLDNINVFLKTCKEKFGLNDSHLFNSSDLEDLSQRAIAETERLKEEYDRRLRNVAITIYWLGKGASSYFQGPQLDLSAYAALVHTRHEADIVERDFGKRSSSSGSSWDWAHGARPGLNPQTSGSSISHTRDSSYDSLEKESVDSLENQLDQDTMPMTRYNSGGALNKNNPNFTTFDSSYSDDKYSSLYRSSPDLSHGQSSHRRYSSTDSMDSSHYSGHSRQGSESNETSYPTRRLRSQVTRKTSTTADPLQFVKFKGAQELAHMAEVQMRVAAESKKMTTTTRSVSDDDAEWQSKLSSWKNRRKSQSEKSYALKETLEEMDREKEEGVNATQSTKTFSQMQEERTRRQSLPNRKFYPIEDDEDDNAFLPSKSTASSDKSSKENKDPWSSDKDDEEDEDNKVEEKTTKSSNSINNSAPLRPSAQNDKNNNSDSNDRGGYSSRRFREDQEEAPSTAPYVRSSSRSKLLEKYKEIDNEDDNTFSGSTSARDSNQRTRRSGMQGIHSEKHSDSFSSPASARDSSAPSSKSDSSKSAVSKARDTFSRGGSADRDAGSALGSSSQRTTTSKSVGPRNQGKIGSILRNFEQSDSKSTMPKQGYNEKIDLSDRRKMFEKPAEEPNVRATTKSSSFTSSSRRFGGGRSSDELSGDSDYTSSDEKKSFSEYGRNREVSSKAESADSARKDYNNTQNSESSVYSARGNNYEFPSRGGNRKDFLDTSKANTDMADESMEGEDGVVDNFSRSDYHSASATPSSLSSSSIVGPTSSGPVYASANVSGRDYVEKVIRINQKPNSDRGFGFILTGGLDKGVPLTVGKVNLGSAADVCDLRAQDRVLMVNGRDVSAFTAIEVGDLVAKAVTTGQIEIRVKRELGDDDEEEEDFSESSDEGDYEDEKQQKEREDNSVQNQLAAERVWLENQMKGEETQKEEVKETRAPFLKLESVEKAEPLPETNSGHRVEIESRQTITLSKPPESSNKPGELSSPSAGSMGHSPSSSFALEEDSDGSGYGPPAILRKWQRQRQKEEYAFDHPEPSTISPIYKKISLNAPLPRRNSDAEETQPKVSSSLNTRLTRPWDEKMDEWTKQQDQQRQPENDQNREQESNQEQFEAEQRKIKEQYEKDLREAEEKERARFQKEQEMLQPELEKARVLEERRAERRARIQKEATGATSTSSSQIYGQDPGAVNGTAASTGQETHVTSMMFNITHTQPPLDSSAYNSQARYGIPSGPPGSTIIIDPRNRQMQVDPGAPVEFQVKLGQTDPNTAALLEAERERIRQEEQRKIEEERRRVEAELKAREEEEIRKIKEKEQQLQQKEEMLRQQREQFLREQEEFKRMQEHQLRQQQQQQLQQQQQQQLPQQLQHLNHDQLAPSKDATNRFSPQRSRSPNTSPYAPVPFHPPRGINNEPSRSSDGSYNSYPGSSSYQPYQNTTPLSQHQPQAAQPAQWASRSEPQPPPTSSVTLARWAPNDSSSSSNNNMDARSGKRFSREEMLAMNRKATPLQSSPPQQTDNQGEGVSSYQPNVSVPITREAPSRTDIVNLNSAPKAKLKDDTEWYGQNAPNSARNVPPSRQPIQPGPPIQPNKNPMPWEAAKRKDGAGSGKYSFAGPGDHWLVQEAERRRIAESEGRLNPNKSGPRGTSPTSHFSGPIKPAAEVTNRWRENNGCREDRGGPNEPEYPSASMPAAIRQTLLQKTASARGPNGSTGSPEQLSPHGQYSPASVSPSNTLTQHPSDNYPYQNNRDTSPSQHSVSPRHSYQPQQQQQYYNQPPQQQQQHYSQPQHHQQPYYPGSSKQPSFQAPPTGPAPPPPNGDTGTAVSGSQLCSQCNQELGFGAAMVIESLGLYFHVQCFRCCVCHASLGTGSQGADVRVRHNHLHCPNCYSNDEAGLKFSKV